MRTGDARDGATVGVEEEFLLVDQRSLRPAEDAGPVLDRVAAGSAVSPWTGERTPARAMAWEMFRRVSPALADTQDLDEIRAALHRVLTDGNAATRQRRLAAEHGVPAALDMLVKETAGSGLALTAR